MGCGSSTVAADVGDDSIRAKALALQQAIHKAAGTGVDVAEAKKKAEEMVVLARALDLAKQRQSPDTTWQWQVDAPATLGKAVHPMGVLITDYAQRFQSLGDEAVERCKAKAPELPAKKRVLMVIDVQDGYDGGFISSLPPDTPGGLAFIQQLHAVYESYELVSKASIRKFAPGEGPCIQYDKFWNRGLDDADFARVCARIVTELRDGSYDLVCFTYDFLEKSNGEEKGVFALDATPWSEPAKPIALVPYASYLTINAGGMGTDVSRRIRDELPEVTNARGAIGEVCGKRALYYRKQVDDAFNENREVSKRTRGAEWLDDVDVDDNGFPNPNAQRLVDKLRALGCGPDEATLVFTGVVTNRCVSSTLLHGVEHGYEAELLEGGCCAADAEQHAQGIALVREKSGGAVLIKP